MMSVGWSVGRVRRRRRGNCAPRVDDDAAAYGENTHQPEENDSRPRVHSRRQLASRIRNQETTLAEVIVRFYQLSFIIIIIIIITWPIMW